MLEAIFKRWEEASEEEVSIESCRDTFCFEIREKFHWVYVYLSELNARGGLVLNVHLQREEGYKKYIKKMFTFELPQNKLEEYPRFYGIYKLVLDMFSGSKTAKVYAKWEEEGINTDITVVVKNRIVDATVVFLFGPNRLYYHIDSNTDRITDELRKVMINTVGLYTLFREYSEKLKYRDNPQENT